MLPIAKMKSTTQIDEPTERFVNMVNQSNLVALDKTLMAIRRSKSSYATAASRTGHIAERIVRAICEIKLFQKGER